MGKAKVNNNEDRRLYVTSIQPFILNKRRGEEKWQLMKKQLKTD